VLSGIVIGYALYLINFRLPGTVGDPYLYEVRCQWKWKELMSRFGCRITCFIITVVNELPRCEVDLFLTFIPARLPFRSWWWYVDIFLFYFKIGLYPANSDAYLQAKGLVRLRIQPSIFNEPRNAICRLAPTLRSAMSYYTTRLGKVCRHRLHPQQSAGLNSVLTRRILEGDGQSDDRNHEKPYNLGGLFLAPKGIMLCYFSLVVLADSKSCFFPQ